MLLVVICNRRRAYKGRFCDATAISVNFCISTISRFCLWLFFSSYYNSIHVISTFCELDLRLLQCLWKSSFSTWCFFGSISQIIDTIQIITHYFRLIIWSSPESFRMLRCKEFRKHFNCYLQFVELKLPSLNGSTNTIFRSRQNHKQNEYFDL